MSEVMPTYIEVWPIAADEIGLWLVSGDDAWRPRLPVMADSSPWDEMDLLLSAHGALDETVIKHGTSVRSDGPARIETYIAVVQSPDYVRARWPEALPISLPMTEAVGRPPTHASTDLPTVRLVDPLLHSLRYLWLGLRHARFLDEYDATAHRDMPPLVRRHIEDLEPILATLYSEVHHAA